MQTAAEACEPHLVNISSGRVRRASGNFRWRLLLRQVICGLAHYTGILRLFEALRSIRNPRSNFTILTYHRVVHQDGVSPDDLPQGMAVSGTVFDLQLAHLAHRYHVVPLEELVALIRQGRPVSPRTVAITLDDGWLDNFEGAEPVLRKYGMTATIFIPTDFIDSSSMLWFHVADTVLRQYDFPEAEYTTLVEASGLPADIRSELLKRKDQPTQTVECLKRAPARLAQRFAQQLLNRSRLDPIPLAGRHCLLSWEQIRMLRDRGIRFGSHTCSHPMLTRLEVAEIDTELSDSRRELERHLELSCQGLAYPNGSYDERVQRSAQRAGYEYACAVYVVSPATDPPDLFALPRLNMHESKCAGACGGFSRAVFSCMVSGFWGPSAFRSALSRDRRA